MNTPLRQPVGVDDLPEPHHQYPVIVTVHKEYVVWVPDAISQAEALDILRDDPEWYELISDRENLANFWEEMRSPGGDHRSATLTQLDWDMIRDGHGDGPYPGLHADAHVRTHRLHVEHEKRMAERKACVAAGHPNLRDPESHTTNRYCPTCGWLKATEVAA